MAWRRLSLRVGGVLDRFILVEVLGPTALGFGTYTFFLLMRPIFTLMEQVFVRGIPFDQALRFLALTVPHVVVLTVPMSYLFGVLLALGRMNGDNEVTALQAAGISTRRMLLPVLGLSLVFAGINGWLTLVLMPRANLELRQMKVELFSSVKSLGVVEPRVFNESFPNLLLFIQDINPVGGGWSRVLLYDRTGSDEERLTLARRGRMLAERPRDSGEGANEGSLNVPGDGDPWLLLEDVTTHVFSTSNPASSSLNVSQQQLVKLLSRESGTVQVNVGMRERDTANLLELREMLKKPAKDPVTERRRIETQRLVLMELHGRLALPFACVVFGLIALPLGIGSRSGGRGRGFVLSVVVILAYYIVYNNGQLLARGDRIPPWAGAWLPNILLALVALVMMRRVGYWLAEHRRGDGWLRRSLRRWRARRGAPPRALSPREREGAAPPLTGSIPISLQRRRYGSRFPSMLDRYVATRLLPPLLLVLVTASSLYVVVDLTDRLDDLAKNPHGLQLAVPYYANLIPQVVLDVAPIGLMIAVLMLLTVMERQVELTAFKAAGISLFRVMVPVLLLAAAVAGGLWALGESAVPSANREAQRLLDRIKGRETQRSYGADRLWLLSRDGTTLYNFLQVDVATQTLFRFTMFRFDESLLELRFQLFADRLVFRDGGWMADSGWFRVFHGDGTEVFQRITRPMEVGVAEGPSYFGQEHRQPGEMSFRQLETYIRELTDSGYRPVKLVVRWYQKITYPLSAFVMVLLALPFGLNRGGRRVTTINGVALALALGIGYFLAVAVFGKMGEANILPPVVGAWAPIGLAVLFALNRMTTLRT